MSLAARCPACATVFRVVQDQLRVSEGWVRCGRCSEVFNAIENLVDLEADVASLPSTRSPSRDRVMEDLAQVSRQFDDETVAAPPSALQDVRADEEVIADAVHEAPSVAPVPEPSAAALPAEPDLRAERAERAYAPTFVQRAEQAARWRRPGVRLALALLAVGAAAVLLAQAVVEYRDLVAARWPVAQPWLEQACDALRCRVEAPRAIEALAVESSGLVRIEGTPMYRLSVVLRNRAALALALPSVDLTLTDSQGSVIARRVIAVAELGTRQATVPALAEMPLQATLNAGERAISGYTIEIFYP